MKYKVNNELSTQATLNRLIRIERRCAMAVCSSDYITAAEADELEAARKACRFSYDPINDVISK